MPVARWGIDWTRRHAASEPAWLRILVLAGAAFIALFYLITALWFDLAYWCLKKFAAGRIGRKARIVTSIALAVVVFGCLAAAGSTGSTAGSSPAVVAIASRGIPSPADPAELSTAPAGPAIAAPSTSASASAATTAASVIDPDDQEPAVSSPGASAGPATTGVPAPSVVLADRLPGEPDPALTPGALNPDVTQATIDSTICVSGWTATVRPDSSYTSSLKLTQMAEYGYEDTASADYEEDHLIPLELGGAPSDARNLWPEPYAATLADGRPTGARVKDEFENELKREVCAGTLTLAAAQTEIGVHWVHAYYDIELPVGPSSTPTVGPTPSPAVSATPPPTAAAQLRVTFVEVPDPGYIGASTSVTASTSSGAVCTVKVTLPSGHASTVKALGTSRTAADGGLVSWSWTIPSNTNPGTAKVAVTCRLGGSSASAQTTFSMVK